jgi:hypothetical protein
LDHDAEEGGTEFALPPTINMPVNEIYWKRKRKTNLRAAEKPTKRCGKD